MRFTHREQQVLRLVAQGLCNKSIGKQLGISPHTVRDHVCAMLLRTGCDNRLQLALRFGHQPPPLHPAELSSASNRRVSALSVPTRG